MNGNTAIFLWAGVSGVLLLQQQPQLPQAGLLLFLLGIFLHFIGKGISNRFLLLVSIVVAGGVMGFGWAAWRAEIRLAQALDPTWEGQDIRLVGEVSSLPQYLERGVRFEFRVRHVETEGARVPERILLSAYEHKKQPEGLPDFKPGETWRLTVRLNRPHGNANPYGFDYESWLLEQNIRATGYVHLVPGSVANPQILADNWPWPPMNGVHRLRYKIREGFTRELGTMPYGGILTALVIGDQRAVDSVLWKVFSRTGTTHLMSISGLHITMVAGVLGFLVNWIWRRFPRLCLRMPAQQAGLLAAWLAALVYGLLAGFGIPTQRTCLMLTVAVIALFSGRRIGTGAILLWALAGVVIFDPWAVLAPGFWLSFGAVAALIWISLYRTCRTVDSDEATGGRWRRLLGEFGRTQWAATLATLPILIWVFQQFPLISPLANLVAIPVVSFIITPLALLGGLLIWIPGLPLLNLAHWLLSGLMWLLEWMVQAPLWQPAMPPLWTLVLAVLGMPVLLMPRGVPGKGAALILFMPLVFWPRTWPEPGTLAVTVLDVGQGQAVLLETSAHTLLYDTGPASGSGDAAQRIVLPFMVGKGISHLDMLVVSHQDSDHAGGLDSIRTATSVGKLVSSMPDLKGGELCARGQSWEWDGVQFQFLHPEPDADLKGSNADSCVLRVKTASGRLLLTGDAGIREERLMLGKSLPDLAAEVILVPHHGSKSSSSVPFVAAVAPDLALVSAGYRNRYGHPKPEVLARYQEVGSQIWRTDRDGALLLNFSQGKVSMQAWRQREQRYWQGL